MLMCGCMSRQALSVNQKPAKKYGVAQVAGGTGESCEMALIISGGRDYNEAISCEHDYIGNSWGIKDKDWNIVEQTTLTENGRIYDMIQVEIPKVGEKHYYYFDVTHYKKKQKTRKKEQAGE
jgi:hypothetical protein